MISLADREALLGVRNPFPALAARIQHTIDNDLLDVTHIVVIQPGDTAADIIAEIGFDPVIGPLGEARSGECSFQPWWDWLQVHDGIYELTLTIGNSGWALIMFVLDGPTELVAMCRDGLRA